jgi:hypothetical protein
MKKTFWKLTKFLRNLLKSILAIMTPQEHDQLIAVGNSILGKIEAHFIQWNGNFYGPNYVERNQLHLMFMYHTREYKIEIRIIEDDNWGYIDVKRPRLGQEHTRCPSDQYVQVGEPIIRFEKLGIIRFNNQNLMLNEFDIPLFLTSLPRNQANDFDT